MGQTFISYRHVEPDESLARALVAALEARGLPVFIDERIEVGTRWVAEIERQIRGSRSRSMRTAELRTISHNSDGIAAGRVLAIHATSSASLSTGRIGERGPAHASTSSAWSWVSRHSRASSSAVIVAARRRSSSAAWSVSLSRTSSRPAR